MKLFEVIAMFMTLIVVMHLQMCIYVQIRSVE